jgi:hypothetical protein
MFVDTWIDKTRWQGFLLDRNKRRRRKREEKNGPSHPQQTPQDRPIFTPLY